MNMQPLLTIRWLNAIEEVDQKQWDELALPLATPLLEWRWLYNLEASGSVSPRYGWQPHHLTLWNGEKLVGAAPLYLKSHSGGEFVFDHWWAQLATEHGINYYPKLVGMSPVTPSVGYQFLCAAGFNQEMLVHSMLSAIDKFCRMRQLSGCHLHFINDPWFSTFPTPGYIAWEHQSYLWKNMGFRCFDDYLKTFKSSQRRNILRERKTMTTLGIEIRTFTGDSISPDMAPLMYRYYLNTNERYGHWAARFLNGAFFERIFQDFRHRLLIIAAYRDNSSVPIAMSMLLVKDDHLIGRYWGCEAPVKDLHFNMCYYAPIHWAIENKIQTFDPGAGSPHKIARGFAAVSNTSLHRFYDQRFKIIFEQIIEEVNNIEKSNIDSLNLHLPFAKKY
jgi:predicted N-acyltransferase